MRRCVRYFSTLRYTKNHEWIEFSKDQKELKIGITNFAQNQLGDIVYIDSDGINIGDEFNEEDVLCNIESVKSTSDIKIPVSGKITEINTQLSDNPQIINDSAENEGWIAKCVPKNFEDLDNLLTQEDYEKLL